jgi:microcystin-dependent protein
LINPTYPVGIGQVLLGPQGNIQLLNNQSTKGVTIQSGTYATSMLVDNLSNLNLRNGLVVTGNASANNITSANNISTATMTISGIATAPTAPATTNTDQLATCAFVLQNQSASTGAEVGFPNTFTATQTFQANSQYPTNINLSRESQIDEASITYNNQVTTLTSPFTFNLSDGINTTVFKPLSNGGCNNNGSAIINQTALNTALSAYPTTASLGTTFAQLTGATFTGDVITPSISATTGTINSSPIITNATITPALSGYAQLSSADFLGTVTAPTIRSTGAISCLSGTINGFPIVSKNNLDTALTAYANLTTANSFTGGTQNFNANNGGGTITETGLTITQNLLNGGACQDIVALNGGYPSNLGLAIWCGTDSVTNGPQTPKVQFYNDTTFTQFNGGVYSNGTLNTTALGITNGANAVGLYCNTGGVLRVEGNVDCNGLLAVGTTTGTFNSTGTSTCPTVTVDDKYPTTDIVNATSLINYVNSQTATSQYFVGQLISGMFPSNSAELLGAGFLYCDGSPLDSANPAYTALYNVIGINYGTSGGTIFYLPDFTGRMALGGNIEQGVGVPVPQFLNQDTQRNQQYSGVYGGYVGTGDFPFHYHPIVDNGHQHSANINWSKSNNANDNQNLKFNSQDGAQQAMVTNTSFTGITQTEIVGSSATIGVMNPYTAVNYFIYAGAP